jgi:hypothetical protein
MNFNLLNIVSFLNDDTTTPDLFNLEDNCMGSGVCPEVGIAV